MALIRARQNIQIQRRGSFGLPVVISTTLPEDPDPVVVEFGMPLQEVSLDIEDFIFNTSNGTFQGNIISWIENYDAHCQGSYPFQAVFDLIPIFRNMPAFFIEVVVEEFKASNKYILASNDDINIE